jgi:hypothetical protein
VTSSAPGGIQYPQAANRAATIVAAIPRTVRPIRTRGVNKRKKKGRDVFPGPRDYCFGLSARRLR